MTNFCVWSRSCLERPSILSGAGANLIGSEPVSAPGPWATGAGAAHKSGGSATLRLHNITLKLSMLQNLYCRLVTKRRFYDTGTDNSNGNKMSTLQHQHQCQLVTKRRLFRPRIRIINVLYCPRFIQHMLLDRYFIEGNG